MKVFPVKKIKANMEKHLQHFPNIHKSGSVSGMKKQCWGQSALCVRCGNYIYLVDEKTYAMAS